MSEAGKTAYITGGASGIGKAVVRMLVEKGIKVCIADRDEAGIKAAISELGDKGKSIMSVKVDAADWDSQVQAFDKAVTEFGRIDYVLPVAGIGERRWLKKDQTEKWTKPDLTVIDVNLTGLIYTVALAIQQFRRQEPNDFGFRGKIMAVASVCGFYAIPTIPVYTASKHGVAGFVRCYGKYLPEEKITINAVCPNVVKTHISTGVFYDRVDKLGYLTPMETLLDAFQAQMGDSQMSGELLECGPVGKYAIRKVPEYLDEPSGILCDIVRERSHPNITP
ncbi:glucose 1-dehydrogenase [Rhizodiscina lignyota]|uniref:Glucose 1-dehydrogenase n=1 Tax=Rhizodiscina lignyota TaxID=1504668 RepID=A0A9P4MG53_9PEZI|nr:glucose 1-dehydrogenase [Rhizodiscina lignyota]